MSQENVEILRELFRKVGKGENPEALYEVLDPDVELDASGISSPEAGIYRGHAEVRAYMRRWAGTWSRWQFAPEEIIEVGDRVVVVLRERGVGKRSGVPVETRGGQVWTFRSGSAVRWQVFDDPDEALDAVGLRE